MAQGYWVVALGAMIAAAPLSAGTAPVSAGPDPSDSPDARYCLRIEPHTGSLVETVRCWTRAEWVDQGVDIDKEWAKEGVTVIR